MPGPVNKRYWRGLLVLFVVLDLAFTFWQNYQLPLDGDLAHVALPSPAFVAVMNDPLGWAVLTKNAVYAAPNRFFAHAILSLYWKQVPHLLQYVVSPINSLYAAGALFATGLQALLLCTLAAYIRLGRSGPTGRWGFWLVVALLVPLFQTNGYNDEMGITDRSITYTFFYAAPASLLLLLFYPFYRAARQQRPLRLGFGQLALLVPLMLVIAFNGPVASAAALVVLLGIGVWWAWQWWSGPRAAAENWLSAQAMGLLAGLGALCVLSLYIGRNNAENTHDHTLWQLYQLLPLGVYKQLTGKLGMPLLVLGLLANAWLVRRARPSAERQWVWGALRGVALFAVAYILLLPLGGYRIYRPYLLRHDSILPVLLGLFYAYGESTYFLLFELRNRARGYYLAAVLVVATIFIYADRHVRQLNGDNAGERRGLVQLAQAPESVVLVRIPPNYTVLSWTPVTDSAASAVPADMLRYWGVTHGRKRYYQ
ncbi:hypothetical protein [Hymenobacter coccineus]|uniref:Glycosyltransferase RgtA/B/C/D-like domain-containing protein n=1 Tax=Hymenobacter coccineus TaxID=1908235 RepID=A0A1G1T1V2_9BACT|nr:hypothetical protein [Hymenobacter coccineus]OGX84842.1 hypothetical protein BEN49_01735 [Hymenobacter coccineus]